MIHLEGIEGPDQNSIGDAWWCFEFSSDHERSSRLHWLYSKMLARSVTGQQLIEGFLFQSETWKEEYGTPHFVKAYQI